MVRPREGAKMVSLSPQSLRVPLQPPDVWSTYKACPWGLSSRTLKWAFFTSRLGVCFSPLSVQWPRGGSLPRTVFPIVTVLWSPRRPALWPAGPFNQRHPSHGLCLPVGFSKAVGESWRPGKSVALSIQGKSAGGRCLPVSLAWLLDRVGGGLPQK